MKRKYYIIVGVVVILMIMIVNKLDNDFMESCVNSGYSKDYCESKK